MHDHVRRGFAAALAAIALVACADSLAPSDPRAVRSSPALSTSGNADGTVICTPCPPGLICPAVCSPLPFEIVPAAGDSTGQRRAS
jgi:hypothetical protein